MGKRIVSKPSRAFSNNFESIFGKQPDGPREAKRTYFVYDLNKGGTIDLADKPRPPRSCSTWPMRSDALGVEASQVAEATAQARELGVPTEFDPRTGEAILTSPGHRKRLAEVLGFQDRNAGYSDPQGSSSYARRFREAMAQQEEQVVYGEGE